MTNIERSGQGVIYSAAGKKYVKEAIISAKSLKKNNKDINITIFVDDKGLLRNSVHLFQYIYEIERPEYSYGDKLYAMKHTPYQETLFLDTDIIITDNISEVFGVLNKYDLAAANVAYNFYYYPHYNTGVIAYSMNKATKNFLDFWNASYDRERENHDQGAFQRALDQRTIKFFTLPSKYNFRPRFASYVKGKIKIVHCHTLNMNKNQRKNFTEFLNSSHKERVWFPRKKIIVNFKPYPNLCLKLLYYFDIFFLKKIKFWHLFQRRWLFHHSLISFFPWLINWVIPMEYRRKMLILNKKIRNYN